MNWKDVDNIVKMTYKGSPYSLKELEIACAKGDDILITELVMALMGPHKDHKAEVYPLSGVKIIPSTHKKRIKSWFDEEMLLHNLYTRANKVKEDMKKAEEDVKVEEIKVPVKKEEVDKKENKPTPKKPVKKPVVKKKIDIGKSIKFEHVICGNEMNAYVPEEDSLYEFPEWTLEFNSILDNGLNVWLYGGTGAGKSSLVEQVCAVGGLPLIYMGLHEDTKPDQLFGGYKLVDGNTIWQDGPVTKAYREGTVLLLDELDAGIPEILFSLFAILDRKPLVLVENGSEIIHPHKNFRVVATGNTLGRGDETGMYSGTNVMNRALLNRFRVWYEVEYPSEEVYKRLIAKEGVSEPVAAVVARLANQINHAYIEGTLTESFSLRDAREIARVTEIVDGNIQRALNITFMSRLSTTEKASINDIYRRLVPDEFPS